MGLLLLSLSQSFDRWLISSAMLYNLKATIFGLLRTRSPATNLIKLEPNSTDFGDVSNFGHAGLTSNKFSAILFLADSAPTLNFLDSTITAPEMTLDSARTSNLESFPQWQSEWIMTAAATQHFNLRESFQIYPNTMVEFLTWPSPLQPEKTMDSSTNGVQIW